MGVVEKFSVSDAVNRGFAHDRGSDHGVGAALLDADQIGRITHDRLPFKQWPAAIRADYEHQAADRVVADQGFMLMLGLLICLSTIVIDLVINPAIVREGAVLRVLAVAPLTLLGLVAAARKWGVVEDLCSMATPIAFGAVIVHLSMHMPPAAEARYLAAAALLIGFANLVHPYSLRGLIVLDGLYIAVVCAVSLSGNPFAFAYNLDFLFLLVIISAGTIQLAYRFETLRRNNYLLTLRAQATSQELLEANRRLCDLSNRDPLTGLPNRRFFEEQFAEMVAARLRDPSVANTQDCRIAVLMIDLDRFKAFNDTHGHQAGDEALRIVGHEMAAILQRSDGIAARYGGEEFVAALCESDDGTVGAVAEEVRHRIATQLVPVGPAGRSTVTASIGIAFASLRDLPQREVLVRAADEALYNAKRAGRNRVKAIEIEPPGADEMEIAAAV